LADGTPSDITRYSTVGFAYGLDFGFRFARRVVLNVLVEGNSYGAGTLITRPTSGSTLFGGTFGFMGNPDRVSFYGEIGAGERHYWFNDPGNRAHGEYPGGEFLLGLGCWIPIGRGFRLLPKIALDVGPFNAPSGAPSGSSAPWHEMLMFGLAGFYNLNFY
jgi:hypothetical protein